MSVAEKISKVMQKVNYLQKDGSISYGRTNYKYLSEEKLTSALNEAFREVGLIIYPAKMELLGEKEVSTKSGKSFIQKILATYRIQDIETDDFIEIQALGEGMDSGDKALNKAMTGAFKYAERQTFMIPTGDDPDHVSSDELVDGEIDRNSYLQKIRAKLKRDPKVKEKIVDFLLDAEMGPDLKKVPELSDEQLQELWKKIA